ncbi:uncharacterized protein NECHADRAFT_88808 [Fusarium vanettenii 77-13-4]|uniref:Uncharacterized protein n=1 Tax=Fusarium vanettenii (strain ATCC MYA-4622 / CBS 123669 / FGSC 9596 / NRRL 45880 / 77-13-4) TaxID=660122 RepID=C7ZKH0_FUSV7|nr:uncharacterized protein NECHADRAFT_88808 [Fusarium vanettenii 77-13-4]EEU35520.1 predicted protein [Fusarium vanettenii 77-13-4]
MPKEKVDYIRRGRELRRFFLEHGTEDNDLGFTQIDLAWMENYSPPQESEEGEEMFPDKWVDESGCVTQSFTSTRAHWRKAMMKLDMEQGAGGQGTVDGVVEEHVLEDVEPRVEDQSPPKGSSLGAGLSSVRRAASKLGEYTQGGSLEEGQSQQEQRQSHPMDQQPATSDGGRAFSVDNPYRQSCTPPPIISTQPERIVQTSWARPSSRDQTFTGGEAPYSDRHQTWDQAYHGDSQHSQQANVPHGVEYSVKSTHPDNSQDWTARNHAAPDRYPPSPPFISGSFPDETAFESSHGHRTQVPNTRDEESYRPFDEWRKAAYAGSGINDTPARPRQGAAQPCTRSHRTEPLPIRPRIPPEPEPQDNHSSVQYLPQPLPTETALAPNIEPRPMRRGHLPPVSVPTSPTTGAKPLHEKVMAEIERRGLGVPTEDKASRSTMEKGKGRAVAEREGKDLQGETRADKSSRRHTRTHRRA